jgi:cyanate permease
MVAGALVLALGFLLAWRTSELATMWAAAGLWGVSFSLVANACGIYLIASWFADRAPRMIALYLMITNLGGVAGPQLADWFVRGEGGWRSIWFWAMVGALLLAVFCGVVIREGPARRTDTEIDAGGTGWGLGRTVRQPQFIVLALAMMLTQACIITVSSVIAAHFERDGWSSTFAAGMLSLQALIGVVGTGLAGPLSERVDLKHVLVATLVAEAVGLLLLADAHALWAIYGFAVLFGIGSSVATFAITVLLIRYFGNTGGSAALSAVWMLCGLGAAGPAIAGYVADSTGGFAPALIGFSAALAPLVLAAWLMKAPASHSPQPVGLRQPA